MKRILFSFLFLFIMAVPCQADYGPGQTAENTSVDTTEFDNNLSDDDDTVQAALETIDEFSLDGDDRYLKLDASNDPLTGALETSNGSILANATASGVLTVGGTGGTYNENLTLDFESTSNMVKLGSTSGAEAFDIRMPLITDGITDSGTVEGATITEGGVGVYNITESDAVYIKDVDLNTFAELQSQIADEVLLKSGTLTDTKYCIYDSASATVICNSEGGSGVETDPVYTAWDKDFDDLTDVPTGLGDGDDDTQLSEAQVDAYAGNNGYLETESDPSVDSSAEIQAIIGANIYQAYDADLMTYAGIAPSANAQTLLAQSFAQMQGSLSVDDLITLSGVASGVANLGTFTGSTIADSQTVKVALQSLETAVEGVGGGHDAVTLSAAAEVLLGLSTQELNLDTQTANYIFAGPASGAAAAPTFRALADADIPDDITITEADPAVTTHESTYNHGNFNTAYGWGDHSVQNYLDKDDDTYVETEADPSVDSSAEIQAIIGASIYQTYDADLMTYAGITPSANAQTLFVQSFAQMKDSLDLEIGADVQAYAANLSEWSGVNPSADGKALVAAATYAAMRALLDLEAGTDFYSKSAADTAISTGLATQDTCAEITGCIESAIVAGDVPGLETDAAHDTCAEITGCVESAITSAGNAATATALAANGENCSAGSYPLGVDASGAVESCTDATTEIAAAINGAGGTDLSCSGGQCNVDAGVMRDSEWTAASTSASGKVELAITSEIDGGSDSTRAIPVDQFVASKRNIRWLVFNLVEAGTANTAADNNIAGDFVSPIAGTVLQSDSSPFYLYATNSTAGVTGTMVVDISFGGTSIMTTNKLDFDTTEKTTTTAATPPDLTDTTLAVGDIITIDVDSIHTTAAKGLIVYMAVRE